MTFLVLLFCYVLMFLGKNTAGTYRKSRFASTWLEAEEHCKLFGGRLATLENLARFQKWLNITDMTQMLDDGADMWVGANLKEGKWTWNDDPEREFNDTVHYYESNGCYNQQYWLGGTLLDDVTPEMCLQHCGWKGRAGLKSSYCMCDNELVKHNVTSGRDAICHIPCSGEPMAMCGGFDTVSIYTTGKLSVSWADGEPSGDNNCALVRKHTRDSQPELVSANCDMRTRYLCSYGRDIVCGVRDTCFRSSSDYVTWWNARTACNLTSLGDNQLTDMDDLGRLAPGSYWVSLHRQSAWYWQSNIPVRMGDFFPSDTGLYTGDDNTCAVLRKSRGQIGLAARNCMDNKLYLCQYDYMAKRNNGVPASSSDETSYDVIADEPHNLTTAWSTSTTEKPRKSTNPGLTGTVSSCLYLVLGFLSGMVCVLILGLIVYAIYRCKAPDQSQPRRLKDKDSPGEPSVSYSSKDGSLHVTPPSSDVTYDTVYDLQGESPFRRSQRLIQMGSANAWRHAPNKRVRSDTLDSSGSDYTWRGMIGGKVEVLDTALRQPYAGHIEGLTVSEAEALALANTRHQRADSLPAKIRTQCDVHPGSPQQVTTIDSLYTLPLDFRSQQRKAFAGQDVDRIRVPGASQHASLYPVTRTVSCNRGNQDIRQYREDGLPAERPASLTLQISGIPSSPRESEGGARSDAEPSFLELRAARNSDSNEENIYATIKKAFQKIKDDLAEEERKDEAATSRHTGRMSDVKLTDL